MIILFLVIFVAVLCGVSNAINLTQTDPVVWERKRRNNIGFAKFIAFMIVPMLVLFLLASMK